MISIIRKNLSSCLVSSPNSFLCNSSNLHFFLSIQSHPFSTSRIEKRLIIPSPEMCDVLVNKHQFSPELASFASSHLPKFGSPKRADSVLSFLKDYSFTSAQLEKIVVYDPRVLGFTVEGLKSRFKVFQDLGLSPLETAKIMSDNNVLLHSSVSNKIIPSLSILKRFLGSNHDVCRLIRKCSWFLHSDLEKILMPNVEILKSVGIPMERVISFLYFHPRCLFIKPHVMRKAVDKAIEFGFSPNLVTFIYAVHGFSYTSEGMWEVKLQTLRKLGFSDDDVYTMCRKQPAVIASSVKKLKDVTELLLATGKYSISNIVSNPSALGSSIEKRLKPRLQILGVMESRNLIEKWPGLSTLYGYNDGKFFDSFIRPYYDEIGEEQITKIYFQGMHKA